MGVITFGRIYQSGSGWVKGVFKLTDSRILWTNPIDGKEKKMLTDDITAAKWVDLQSGCILKLELRGGASIRYTGFKTSDRKTFADHFSEHFKTKITAEHVDSAGHNWGNLSVANNTLTFAGTAGKTAFEVSMSDISQCAVPNDNEVEIQFAEENAEQVETMVSMRFFIPPGATVEGMGGGDDDEDDVASSAANEFQQQMVERCGLGTNTGDVLVEFDEKLGSFLTPRGRYKIEMFAKEMRLHGKTYDYTIQYKHVARLYLLPKKMDTLFAFVISLSVPIRQGAQRYAHLVMQLSTKDHLVQVNLSKKQIVERYGEKSLDEEVRGNLHKVVARVFRALVGRKIYTTGKFKNYRGDKAIKCTLKSNEGQLFPLDQSFFFIHKPPTFIPFASIIFVEFARYQSTGPMQSRTFDLQVVCKTPDGRSERDITFQGMDRNEYSKLFTFLSDKKINIRNITAATDRSAGAVGAGADFASDSENDSDFSGGDSSGGSSEDGSDFDEDGSDSDSDDGKSSKGKQRSKEEVKRKAKAKAGKAKKKKFRSK